MSSAQQVLKEPFQDVLRNFAFLDIELRPSDGVLDAKWKLCAAVALDGPNGGTVAIFASFELAILAADNFLGVQSNSEQQIDVICELANVIAGQTYEILHGGKKPISIDPPALLSSCPASAFWNESPPASRYVLCSEEGVLGAIIVSLPEEWSSKWV